jgi:hypothetical protein
VKSLIPVGLVLVAIGLIGLIYGGITYTKNKDTVDLGVAEVPFTEKERLQIHPAIGGVVLVAGLVVTGIGLRRKRA